jgi:hypothetical protein
MENRRLTGPAQAGLTFAHKPDASDPREDEVLMANIPWVNADAAP